MVDRWGHSPITGRSAANSIAMPSNVACGRNPSPVVADRSHRNHRGLRLSCRRPPKTATHSRAPPERGASITRRRIAISRPSRGRHVSVMNRGTAPLTARSLTVPCTASEPIFPPGTQWLDGEAIGGHHHIPDRPAWAVRQRPRCCPARDSQARRQIPASISSRISRPHCRARG